jgi:hypothetical protein
VIRTAHLYRSPDIACHPFGLYRGSVHFEIIGTMTDVENIAVGTSIRQLSRLRRRYGRGRWRKLKGLATVRVTSGEIRRAEVHWYEAHGIGRVGHKIKRFLD